MAVVRRLQDDRLSQHRARPPGARARADPSPAHFLGAISPPILLLALPGLALALWSLRPASATGEERIGLIALAWVLGTFLPFQLASTIEDRTSYLYYMVIVMPGIYIAVTRFVAHSRAPRWLVGLWVAGVAVAVVLMYPFTPLPW